jgi:hypothetical protein
MSGWPAPIDDAALHGPAGEFVLRTEPHSEAHPVALLTQFRHRARERLSGATAPTPRRWVFGDSLGDPTVDEIWTAAKERRTGLTRTEVSDMFSRNKKRREIERALIVLEEAGRLRRETRTTERGRPAEIWMPVLADAA